MCKDSSISQMSFIAKAKMRFPMLWLFIVWLITPLTILLSAGWFVYLQMLPKAITNLQYSQTHTIELARTPMGVTNISANAELGVYYGLGYAHAQDRLWQMEFNKRLAKGRLSEILGQSALNSDRFIRTLGIEKVSIQAYQTLADGTKKVLAAYCDGVNAWIETDNFLPPEFYMLDITPMKCEPADAIMLVKLMALDLGANFRDELNNEVLRQHLGDRKFAQLLGFDSPQSVLKSAHNEQEVQTLLSSVDAVFSTSGWGKEGVGSNAWAISGEYSLSGKPLLAGDPHLGLSLPSHFYLASLRGGDLMVQGASLPGIPVIVFGNNKHIAWAGTNLAADVQDLFREEVDQTNPMQYKVDGQWTAFDTRTETVSIASPFPGFLRPKIAPVSWTVRESRHGPIISDFIHNDGSTLALRWSALDPEDNTLEAFLALNKATNWSSFNHALSQFHAPALNFVYSDIKGNIGMTVAGNIPVRNYDSRFINDASDGRKWQGYIPFQQLPKTYNPEQGFVVSANNQIHSNEYPYVLSSNWQPDYRADRITDMITNKISEEQKMDKAFMVAMQSDNYNPLGQKALLFLNTLSGKTEQQRMLLAHLKEWDLEMSHQSVAATIFHAWYEAFTQLVFEDDLQPDLTFSQNESILNAVMKHPRPLLMESIMSDMNLPWCDDIRTPDNESCEEIALQALDKAFRDLHLHFGSDNVVAWHWGDIHKVELPHLGFGQHEFLQRVFNISDSADGSPYSVNVSQGRYQKGIGYVKSLGASYKQVIDMQEPLEGLFSIDAGQSGHLLSEHYDDFVRLHNSGTLVPFSAREK